MFDFFATILGYFETSWNMFLNIIQSLFMAVAMVANSLQFTLSLVAFVPPLIATGVIIFIAVFVVRFLLLK